MVEWTNLTTQRGEVIQNPGDEDLRTALRQLFQSKDNEHPDAWIECGSENGPLHSLSVFSSGYALYTKFSDADMTEELEYRRIDGVTEELAYAIWKKLMDIGEV